MKTALCGLSLAFLCLCVSGQVLTTNLVQAHPDFRTVRGQLYNIELSRLWRDQHGIVHYVSNNVAIVQTLIPEEIILEPAVRGIPFNQNGREGRIGGGWRVTPQPAKKKTIYNPGRYIAITNLPASELERDVEGRWTCMEVGKYQFDDKRIYLHDVGKPHVVAVIQTNPPAKK